MDKGFKKIPIRSATALPKEGIFEVVSGYWWAVTEDDCILIYDGFSRQCNRDKRVVDYLIKNTDHPGVVAKYIETVYLRK